MLPTSGYFKNLICPFYKVALCCRPQCHFRHDRSQNDNNEDYEETETLLDTDHKSELLTIFNASNTDVQIEENEAEVTYIPTPVDEFEKPNTILKVKNNSKISSSVPEYKPTPISKLKEYNDSKKNKIPYIPDNYSNNLKKKKVEEYDPTEVKCSNKKSVTFSVANELQGINDVVDETSDDDDDNYTGSPPKFSDDDADDLDEDFSKNNISYIPAETKESDKISEFSLVDKILVDCKKNEKLLSGYRKNVVSNTPVSSKLNDSKNESLNLEIKKKMKPINKNSSRESNKDKDVVDTILLQLDSSNSKEAHSNNKSSKNSKRKENLLENDLSKKKAKIITSENLKNKDSKTSNNKSAQESKNKSIDAHKGKEKKIKSKSASDQSSKSKNILKSTDKKIVKISKSNNDLDNKKIQDGKVSSSSIIKKTHEELNNFAKNLQNNAPNKDEKTTKQSYSNPKKSNKIKQNEADLDSQYENNKPLEKLTSNSLPKQIENVDILSDDDDIILSSDSDKDEECWRIFNETFVDSSNKPLVFTPETKEAPRIRDSSQDEITVLGKKRTAHEKAAELKKPVNKNAAIKKPLNPAQVMHNRFLQLQEKAAQLNEEQVQNCLNSKPPEKKRIEFAPNSSLLAAVTQKNRFGPLASLPNDFSPLPATVSKTYKDTKRIAHVPSNIKKSRPIIPSTYGSKVPSNMRQKFLNAFIDECLKFTSSEDIAYETALEEEKKCYERSSSRAIYMNVASNTLARLRHRPEVQNIDYNSSDTVSSTTNLPEKASKKTVSHEIMLAGPKAMRTSFSIERKKPKNQDVAIKGKMLYDLLLEYIMKEEQLEENGYPFMNPDEPGRAIISPNAPHKTTYCNEAFKRTCCRCQKTYFVNVEGDYVKDEECDFHWGRLFRRRIAGAFESRYACCQGDAESDGCCVSPGHVYEGSEANALKGFVKTLPKSPPPDQYYGIYSLDCEMCYTTAGIELTRVTVIDPDLKAVFETYVKPQNKVLDYNTRFSGITEEDLVNVKTSLPQVQAVLLSMFNDKTILIGHSLESDFKALKLVHTTVIDTSIVFPHKLGPPHKRALKTLMAEKLNKIIQNSVFGHDSNEDAVACMELMLWKIKEDAKSYR